jgi:2-dehydropantoate 2-reductase
MKIAIVGAGAIGGFLGVRLAEAGADVTFIARGANLDAIQTQGMRLIEEDGSEKHCRSARAASIERAGAHDYVLLTMKSHQVAPVAASIEALCHPTTTIVTMQNGVPWWYFYGLKGDYEGTTLHSVDPEKTVWNALKPERVVGSIVYPAAELIAPGVVRVIEGNRFTLGEPSGEKTPRVMALAQRMITAGFKTPVSSDIRSELWVKLWGNLAFNPISALTHATLEDICSVPLTRDIAARMMTEAQAVGEKLGVVFKIPIDKRIAGAQAVGAHKTSMLQDIEAGKAPELEALTGAVVELGRLTGTPTPTIDTVYGLTRMLAQTIATQHGRLRVEALP